MKPLFLFAFIASVFLWPSCSEAVGVDSAFDAVFVRPLATANVIVVRSKDGTERSVRLFGVACPVTPQPHARQAVDFLTSRLKGASLSVEVLTTDNQGLPVAWVRSMDGTRINEEILQKGLGWWDEPNAPDATKLRKYTVEALTAGKGLWKDTAPLAPWDYRASHNLPLVTYKVEPEANVAKETEAAKEETPTLAAKGTMKARPALPAIPQEYMGLVAKHRPRIAQDAQGNPLGLTASDISSIPGATQIGLQNGDIVTSINGMAITNPAQLMGMYGKLRNARQLDIQIIRDGGPIAISIPL
ncbi:MAG: thermonuclease family protein [Candidatus Hydrogenedentes bacterium]|nr:thermonuclease family protein [Candidatus Hydrogenedentota bacterium]